MGVRTTSSRKSTQGARNDAPHSAAVALASRVFPVPAMATRAGDLCLTHLTSGNAVCTSRSSRAG